VLDGRGDEGEESWPVEEEEDEEEEEEEDEGLDAESED